MTTLIPRLPEEMVREVKGYIDFNNLESTNMDYIDESNLTNSKFIAIMENYPPLATMLDEFTGEERAKIYRKYVIDPVHANILIPRYADEKRITQELFPRLIYISNSTNPLSQAFVLLLLIHHSFQHPNKVNRGYVFGTMAYNLYRCISVLYKMKKKITNIMNQLCVTGSIFHEMSKINISVPLNIASNLFKYRVFRKYNPNLTYGQCKNISTKIAPNDSSRLIDQKLSIFKQEFGLVTYLNRLNKQANMVVKFGNKSNFKNKKRNQLALLKIAKAAAKVAEKEAKAAAKVAAKVAEKEAKAAAKVAAKEAKVAAKMAEKEAKAAAKVAAKMAEKEAKAAAKVAAKKATKK